MKKNWFLLDFDNCQMATERLTIPVLIERFNTLYGDQIESPLTYELFKQYFHGQARESLCFSLSQHYGIVIDYPSLYKDRVWNMMRLMQEKGVQMAAHLVETLDVLQEKGGYQFAFVSNNPVQQGLTAMRYATNGQGERLARFFGTAFFEAGEVQKPKPDVYLRAMEQLGLSPQQCYAVEDSPAGVLAAVAAGLSTFGYLGFADDPQEAEQALKAAGVSACFSDWAELPAMVL